MQKSPSPTAPVAGSAAHKAGYDSKFGYSVEFDCPPFEMTDQEWHTHNDKILVHYGPVGPIELAIAERISLLLWQIAAVNAARVDHPGPVDRFLKNPGNPEHARAINSMGRYEGQLDRSLVRAMQELRRCRKERPEYADRVYPYGMTIPPACSDPVLAQGFGAAELPALEEKREQQEVAELVVAAVAEQEVVPAMPVETAVDRLEESVVEPDWCSPVVVPNHPSIVAAERTSPGRRSDHAEDAFAHPSDEDMIALLKHHLNPEFLHRE